MYVKPLYDLYEQMLNCRFCGQFPCQDHKKEADEANKKLDKLIKPKQTMPGDPEVRELVR